MICTKCEKKKHRIDLLYDDKTLEVYCKDCLEDGIPYNKINDYLKTSFTELYNMKQRATSTRLDLSQLIYLMKYSQHHRTGNISSTVSAIISKMMDKDSLTSIDLIGSPFKRKKKPQKLHDYLEMKEYDKETLTLGNEKDDMPDKLVNLDQEATPIDEDEDVFTL